MNAKTLALAAMAALSTAAASAPALAQYGPPHGPPPAGPGGGPGYGPGGGGPGINWNGDWRGDLRGREDRIQNWINTARADGRLPRDRAFHAQGFLDSIRRSQRGLFQRQGGIGPGQRAAIEGKLNHLVDYIRESGYRD